MKNHHLFLIVFCLLLSSCGLVSANYFGDTLAAPTTNVDVYYSAHDVKKDYKVIGHLTCTNVGQDATTRALTNKAKAVGADAIVITGDTVDASGKYSSDTVTADALKYN
jgi:5,10-methylenetetrahydrofolate reductase